MMEELFFPNREKGSETIFLTMMTNIIRVITFLLKNISEKKESLFKDA